MRTILYRVTFAASPKGNYLHLRPYESQVATVKAIEDCDAFRAYHLDDGKHLTPDYAAIRDAIPHYHRKAFDRAGTWFFPITLNSALSGIPDRKNAASLYLSDARGNPLGTLYATPYLFDR